MRVLSTINVSLRVSDVKNVDVEQADNSNYWKSSTETILCFNVSWLGTISARARDIMGYPANVLSKGSYIFRKYQNRDVPPFRHARITLEDTPGDGVSILLLSDELTPTCSGWKQQGHGHLGTPSHQHSRQGGIWGSFPLWRYNHVRYWMNRQIDALFSLQVFL